MIAENLKRLRKEKGLTQRALSTKSGIAEITIRNYEAGKYKPKMDNLLKIANALGTTVSEISGETLHELVLPAWIPCSERLPEIKQFESYSPETDLDPEMEYYVSDWFLVTTPYENEPICIAHAWRETKANEYGWEDASDHVYTLDEVLAWMPLPEPYKEENNDNSRETE